MANLVDIFAQNLRIRLCRGRVPFLIHKLCMTPAVTLGVWLDFTVFAARWIDVRNVMWCFIAFFIDLFDYRLIYFDYPLSYRINLAVM